MRFFDCRFYLNHYTDSKKKILYTIYNSTAHDNENAYFHWSSPRSHVIPLTVPPPLQITHTYTLHTHLHLRTVPRRAQLSSGEWVTVGPNSEYNTHNSEIRGPLVQTSSAEQAATSFPLYDDRLKKNKIKKLG